MQFYERERETISSEMIGGCLNFTEENNNFLLVGMVNLEGSRLIVRLD